MIKETYYKMKDLNLLGMNSKMFLVKGLKSEKMFAMKEIDMSSLSMKNGELAHTPERVIHDTK